MASFIIAKARRATAIAMHNGLFNLKRGPKQFTSSITFLIDIWKAQIYAKYRRWTLFCY